MTSEFRWMIKWAALAGLLGLALDVSGWRLVLFAIIINWMGLIIYTRRPQ